MTFENTHGSIRAEQLLLEANIPVAVMPLPAAIHAGCGLCLRISPGARTNAAAVLAQDGVQIEGSYLTGGGLNQGEFRQGEFRLFPLPVFTQAMGLRPGDVVSIVGCGGKTALQNRLAAENRDRPVLLSTTVKILRPPDEVIDCDTASRPLSPGVHLLCSPAGQKLGAVDPQLLSDTIPGDGITLLEADGSRGRPLKGWGDDEPVIHRRTTVTVGVCTVWAVGHAASDAIVHRPERFYPLTGASPGKPVTLQHIAAMINGPGGLFSHARGRRILLINQVESPGAGKMAEELAGLAPAVAGTVLAGSVQGGTVQAL